MLPSRSQLSLADNTAQAIVGEFLPGYVWSPLFLHHELPGSWCLRFRRQVQARSLVAVVRVSGSRRGAWQMSSLVKPTLILMSGRALAFTATFFIPVVLARLFDQTEFGIYKQLFLIFSTLYVIAQVGMAESLFYFLPQASHEPGRYVLNSLLVLAAAGLACLGLLTLAASKIAQWMNTSALSEYIPWIGVYVLLMITSAVLEIVMTVRKRYLWAASTYAVSDLLRALLLIVPVLLFRRMEWLLLGAVVFASVRLCEALVYLRYEFGGELRPDPTVLTKQLTYAFLYQMAVLVDVFQSNFHQYAVSYYFD